LRMTVLEARAPRPRFPIYSRNFFHHLMRAGIIDEPGQDIDTAG
jgi:hypothetical protein